MNVQSTSKTQPRAEYIKAVAKIVEALDPIYAHEREKCIAAAVLILDDPNLCKKILEKP